jgi:glycosyltransferase involved in cell wall biosynthesis
MVSPDRNAYENGGSAALPMVSIITVVLNAAGTIGRTIESVLAQDYLNVEYIVIDGASTDGTKDIVETYRGRLATFVSEPDSGIYDSMMKAFRYTHGDMILFMNSDDVFKHASSLSSMIEFRCKYSMDTPSIVYSDFTKYYPTLDYFLETAASSDFERGMTLCHQAMIADRSAFDLVGGFDLSLRHAADFDWVLRARRLGVRFIKAPVPPTVIFRHGGQSEINYRQNRLEAARIIRRELGLAPYWRFQARQYLIFIARGISDIVARALGQRLALAAQRSYLKMCRERSGTK